MNKSDFFRNKFSHIKYRQKEGRDAILFDSEMRPNFLLSALMACAFLLLIVASIIAIIPYYLLVFFSYLRKIHIRKKADPLMDIFREGNAAGQVREISDARKSKQNVDRKKVG